MEVKLALLKGCQEHSDVTINSLPFVIGRCRTADFIIAHVNVSRNHCRIVREDSVWKVIDSSSSGTFINNSLVGREKCGVLNEGDVIRFGPVESNLSWSFHPLETSNTNLEVNEPKNFQPQVLIANPAEKETLKCDKNEVKSSDRLLNASEIKSELDCDETVSLSDLQSKTKNEFKQEEEESKKELLQKLREIKEAEKVLFHKLAENEMHLFEKIHGEKQVEEKTEQSSFLQCKKEIPEDSKLNTQDILEELEQVKSVLSDLENKNSALEGKLAEVSNIKTEPSDVQSSLLENFADLMETELQCTICSELFVTAITLGCTHTFCKHCIDQWKKKQKTCPICRKKITNETRSLVVDNYIDKMVENLSADLKKRRAAIVLERQEASNPKRKRSNKCR